MEGKNVITNERRFYPLLVSAVGLDAQTDTESNQVWKQLSQIPQNNKKILLSTSIIENLEQAEKKFSWEPQCSARLAYFVRELFFQNISQSEFYKATEALLSPKYQARYNEILAYINNVILTSQPDPEEEEEKETPAALTEEGMLKRHTLLDALSRYPNIANQFITTASIKLKSQAALVRPTLSNWLKNYRDELGIGKHDAVARANFLFESLNTKKLSSNERERLHSLVRSLEDNELLDINIKSQEILFADEDQGENSSVQNLKGQELPSPDIFERFQHLSPPPPPVIPAPPAPVREELQKVGTHTFVSEKPAGENQIAEGGVQHTGPLGTIRFSAGHILPAERYDTENYAQMSPDPRIQHFRPKPVPIPQSSLAAPAMTVPTSVPVQPPIVPPTEIKPPVAPPIPAPRPMSPTSVFRIKPNNDERV